MREAQQSPVERALYQFMQETIAQLIATALEEELQEFLRFHDEIRLRDGARAVVRNGYLPTRTIVTSIGEIAVRVPRTRDRSGAGIHFSSSILPRYLSRSRLNSLLPELFLRSCLDGNTRALLQAVLGTQVEHASNGVLERAQGLWTAQCLQWRQRLHAGNAHLFWWAGSLDGVIAKTQLLFIVGLHHDGRHELVVVAEVSPSAESAWSGLLRQLRKQGFDNSPKLLDAGRRPDLWQAVKLYYPETLIIGQGNQNTDQQPAQAAPPRLHYV